MRLTVTGLSIYPVKGARGINVDEMPVGITGPVNDRRFMLVDTGGTFITQREEPRLALLEPKIVNRILVLGGPYGPGVLTAPSYPYWDAAWQERIMVRVWDDTVEAVVQTDVVNDRILRGMFGRDVRLVYLPDSSIRPARKQSGDDIVRNGFADAYPFLLTTSASLAWLNERAKKPIPMNRFRTNIEVDGGEPFWEETARRFRIGDVVFHGMRRCARCKVTVRDQATARLAGPEPMRTLVEYRKFGTEDYCFGMNLNHQNRGTIRVGDEVEILEVGEPYFPHHK